MDNCTFMEYDSTQISGPGECTNKSDGTSFTLFLT